MKEKKVSLTIRLLPEEKMRVKRWALEAGISVSDYVMVAIREQLKKDETPQEERSDIDLMENALNKIAGASTHKLPVKELDDKSLMELIGDYVKKDE